VQSPTGPTLDPVAGQQPPLQQRRLRQGSGERGEVRHRRWRGWSLEPRSSPAPRPIAGCSTRGGRPEPGRGITGGRWAVEAVAAAGAAGWSSPGATRPARRRARRRARSWQAEQPCSRAASWPARTRKGTTDPRGAWAGARGLPRRTAAGVFSAASAPGWGVGAAGRLASARACRQSKGGKVWRVNPALGHRAPEGSRVPPQRRAGRSGYRWRPAAPGASACPGPGRRWGCGPAWAAAREGGRDKRLAFQARTLGRAATPTIIPPPLLCPAVPPPDLTASRVRTQRSRETLRASATWTPAAWPLPAKLLGSKRCQVFFKGGAKEAEGPESVRNN
jgi:hypothetical protein